MLPGSPRALPRLALVAAVLVAAGLSGCSYAGYLAEQGRGQLRILRQRRRISDVLLDPSAPVATKDKLRLALRARRFGVEVLGLRGGDAYTRYLDTGDEPIAWSVYAAYPDRLQPYLHRFPIAGAVPYLGFFDKASALREQARLQAQGLDTYLVPVAGYSTLGWTADPVYSSMIEGSDASVVEVVLHEMLHGTLYRPGRSEWNESLATLVGQQGAIAFFLSEGGGAAAARRVVDEARERERRSEDLAGFLRPLIARLEALYGGPLSKEEKLRQRQEIFEQAIVDYRARFPPRPGDKKPRALARQPLNNAVLLAFTTYHRSLPEFRAELAADQGDLRKFIARYKRRYGRP